MHPLDLGLVVRGDSGETRLETITGSKGLSCDSSAERDQRVKLWQRSGHRGIMKNPCIGCVQMYMDKVLSTLGLVMIKLVSGRGRACWHPGRRRIRSNESPWSSKSAISKV